ncbi:ester cyclase [Actinopolymorpha sp. NPDC004070]|uniref:ester cyclase n=1 Tax=Actinopolymorpha sp. NPDC004070 TaxID=3154548 RepID=UPI00339F8BBE
MNSLVRQILRLWDEPIVDWAAAETAFRAVYADPVVVNDVKLAVTDLVRRALALQETYEGRTTDIIETFESDGRIALAVRMRGRHVGALATPLGPVAPTGRMVEIRVIDLLTVSGGRVTAVTTLSDELGLLRQLDAVALI